MNIVIDTSILQRDRGFLQSDILLLKKLAKLDLIKIHIPWIVYKELTSQNIKESNSVLFKSISEISSLNKKGISKEDYLELEKVISQLNSLKDSLNMSIDKHWADFVTDSKATLHEINDGHGKLVMSSYFTGDKPFPEPKSRKDIPDAFIYEAIKSIREKVGEIHFICADNNLRNSIDGLDYCTGFSSYADFYKSPKYVVIESEYKKIEHYSDELILLRENVDKISKFAESEIYGDVFAGNDQVITNESILSDDREGAIQDMEDVTIDIVHLDTIQFVDGIFYISIDISGKFGIEYFMYKSDYYMEAKDRNISIIDDDWNKHYFLVYEIFDVRISYQCSVVQDSVRRKEFEFETEQVIIKELNIINK